MAEVFRKAGGAPIAVLKNNRPDFYVLTPELFEVVVDVLDDFMMRDEVLARHRSGEFAEVELEDL
jgi:antitoxin StbD